MGTQFPAAVIVLTGFQFSGKTEVGKTLSGLTELHHIDDDVIRHALFSRNSLLSLEDRQNAYAYMRKVLADAVEMNAKMGRGVLVSSTFGSDEAKRLFLEFWKRYHETIPIYVFRLMIPAEKRERIVKQRAIERYGRDEKVLIRKLEGYEYMRKTTTPWPVEVGAIEIDASQSINEVCQSIIRHVVESIGSA